VKSCEFSCLKMRKCNVPGCANKQTRQKSELSFHSCPSNYIVAGQWTEFLQSIDSDHEGMTEYSYICSAHFSDTCYKILGRLLADAVPTIVISKSSSNESNKRVMEVVEVVESEPNKRQRFGTADAKPSCSLV